MANQWLRLWHDMPTDPKFGTVARVSGEPVSLVLSVYLHLMVDASRNVTRGHVTVTAEDLATALSVTDEQIERVLAAMEGRLVDAGYLSGWEKRQPKREDSGDETTGAKSAAQRKKEQREREAAARESNAIHGTDTQSHDASRNVTLDKDEEEDKEKEVNTESAAHSTPAKRTPAKPKADGIAKPDDVAEQTWADWLLLRKDKKAAVTQTVLNGARQEAEKAGMSLEDFLQVWCRRGSQGLEADWLKPNERKQSAPAKQPKSFAQQEREAGWARWEEMTNQVHPDRIKAEQQTGRVIDITPRTLEIAQ